MFVRLLGFLLLAGLAACQHHSTATSPGSEPTPLPANCSAPPPVRDIWALAPLLKKQGLITDTMSRDEQEAAIRAYIERKNQQFLKCNN